MHFEGRHYIKLGIFLKKLFREIFSFGGVFNFDMVGDLHIMTFDVIPVKVGEPVVGLDFSEVGSFLSVLFEKVCDKGLDEFPHIHLVFSWPLDLVILDLVVQGVDIIVKEWRETHYELVNQNA